MSKPLPHAAPVKSTEKTLTDLRARALPRLLASLLLAAGFVWLFRRGGLPLLPGRDALSMLQPWAIPTYVSFTWSATYFRNFRWVHLLRPIAPRAPRFRVLGIAFVGYSSVFISPLRMGEVVRPYLLSRDREVTFFQALGTVGAERAIDGLFLMLISFCALQLAPQISPLPDHLGELPLPVSAVPAAMYSTLLVFAGALGAMVVFFLARSLARRIVESTVGLISKRASSWLTATLERLADGLSFLPARRHLARFLRDTLVYWTLTMAAQLTMLRGVGLSANPAQACVTAGVMGLGTLLPAGPGFFGAYQLSAFTALSLFYPASEVLTRGTAFVFCAYCVQLTTNLLGFAPGFWLMRRFPAPEPR